MKDIISIAMGELTTAFDNEVVKAVQKVGIDVDKEELLKALDLYHNLVRCGECKYCGKDRIKWSAKDDDGNWIDTKFNACYALADSKIGIKEVSLDDYCSWGERKGDE